MHETGIVRNFVRRLDETANANGAHRIRCAHVWIGALSQFSAGHFREHFEEEARGTLAEGAELEIEESADPLDPSAHHVVIHSVELEVQE